MTTYNINQFNYIQVSATMSVPADPNNRHYAAILREVAAGTAEVIPYTAPE